MSSVYIYIFKPGHVGGAAAGEARRGPWQWEAPTQHYQVAKEGDGSQHTWIEQFKVKITTTNFKQD